MKNCSPRLLSLHLFNSSSHHLLISSSPHFLYRFLGRRLVLLLHFNLLITFVLGIFNRCWNTRQRPIIFNLNRWPNMKFQQKIRFVCVCVCESQATLNKIRMMKYFPIILFAVLMLITFSLFHFKSSQHNVISHVTCFKYCEWII